MYDLSFFMAKRERNGVGIDVPKKRKSLLQTTFRVYRVTEM